MRESSTVSALREILVRRHLELLARDTEQRRSNLEDLEADANHIIAEVHPDLRFAPWSNPPGDFIELVAFSELDTPSLDDVEAIITLVHDLSADLHDPIRVRWHRTDWLTFVTFGAEHTYLDASAVITRDPAVVFTHPWCIGITDDASAVIAAAKVATLGAPANDLVGRMTRLARDGQLVSIRVMRSGRLGEAIWTDPQSLAPDEDGWSSLAQRVLAELGQS